MPSERAPSIVASSSTRLAVSLNSLKVRAFSASRTLRITPVSDFLAAGIPCGISHLWFDLVPAMRLARWRSTMPGRIYASTVCRRDRWKLRGICATSTRSTPHAPRTTRLSAVTPDEIAAGAVYLAGEESTFMTGADLLIDGGYTAV
jgi:hypothetical protein